MTTAAARAGRPSRSRGRWSTRPTRRPARPVMMTRSSCCPRSPSPARPAAGLPSPRRLEAEAAAVEAAAPSPARRGGWPPGRRSRGRGRQRDPLWPATGNGGPHPRGRAIACEARCERSENLIAQRAPGRAGAMRRSPQCPL